MSKKKVLPSRKLPTVVPAALLPGLKSAIALIDQKRPAEARVVLEDLHRRFPGRAEILEALMSVAFELSDMPFYEGIAEQLFKLKPQDETLMVALAATYMSNMRPVLALQMLRGFLAKWPQHALAGEARGMLDTLESHIDEHLEIAGLTGPNGLEIAALSERMQALFQRGQYRETRQTAQTLLARRPQYAPALNNISQSYFAENNLDQAIITARSVLDFEPENVHALSNLVRYAVLSGFMEEAQEFATQMQASQARAVDKPLKIAEALSYLGDDAGVLAAYERAEATQHEDLSFKNPFLHHLAGVAALRQGNANETKRHWKRAVEIDPNFEVARANLLDLNKPVGERHAPWPFPIHNWLLPGALQALKAEIGGAAENNAEAELADVTRAYLSRHPEFEALAPILLDRGDPQARTLALTVAGLAKTPALLTALRDFALGQRGPDELRMEALHFLGEAKQIENGLVQMWVQGQWQTTTSMNYEIYGEPVIRHAPHIQKAIEDSMTLLRVGDTKKAEALLQEALEEEPDDPTLLNNMAAVYGAQHRNADMNEMMRYLHARHPDYIFGRANMAHIYIREGNLEQARAMLEPVLKTPRLHASEFSSLCSAQIVLAMAEGQQETAQTWLELWERFASDSGDLSHFKRLVEKGPVALILPTLKSLAEGFKSKRKRREPNPK